jgi:hypothetical protein
MHTAALLHTAAVPDTCTLPHTTAHCRTLPHITAAHCCKHYYTLLRALPHTGRCTPHTSACTASNIRAHCHTMPHYRTLQHCRTATPCRVHRHTLLCTLRTLHELKCRTPHTAYWTPHTVAHRKYHELKQLHVNE